jgi:hypothetical protein
VVDERWSTLTPALSPRRGSAMQPPERFIVFAAFDSATNAEGNVPIFRALAALPLLGGEGRGEGERFPTTISRCAPLSFVKYSSSPSAPEAAR